MRVLHISNGFAGSEVHGNLVRELEKCGLQQTIYAPVRSASAIGGNQFESDKVEFVYSNIIKPWYKFVYHHRAKVLYRDMVSKINVNDHDIIHAASLFSDGILAYKAYKQYGVPYVIAVRNTDYNDFIRLLRHTWHNGREIMLHASKIFFISEGIKKQFENSAFVEPILDKVNEKFVLLPNGIDDYWIDHVTSDSRKGHQILYIGDFSENKNVARLIEAVLQLRKESGFEDVGLTIVGGGKNTTDKVQNLIDKHTNCIKYLGKIYDKQRLSEVMSSCSVFAMPSIHETFGLVYLEALSQNLPVLYTKGQGIDGLFDDTVGISVNPFSVDEIVKALHSMLTQRDKYSNAHVDFSLFKWSDIAKQYKIYYQEIVE
jgi:glycosyltransferase involved in cell wall biosynthesis